MEFHDTFQLHKDAQGHVERLRGMLPEFRHLVGSRIVCLGSQRQPMLRGFPVRAFIGAPKVQGPYRSLFEFLAVGLCEPVTGRDCPEFLVVFDAALWPSLDKLQRERLVYHELCHLRTKENEETGEPRLHEDGRPQLQVVPHDVEVFTAEVERYGAGACELDALCEAIVEGQKRGARQRAVRSA